MPPATAQPAPRRPTLTIPLTSAGGLMVRTGHIVARMIDANALRGGPPSPRCLSGANEAAGVIATILPDYAAGTPLPQVGDGLPGALSTFQQAVGGWLQDLKGRVINTLLAMYAIDVQAANPNAPLNQLMAGADLKAALATLVAQMQAAGASVQAATVTAGALTAVGTPRGNPTAVVSLKNSQGQPLQLVFPETLTLTAAGDSQGGATLGNEPIRVTGQAAVTDALSHLWPGGSNANATLNLVDGSKDNSAGNLLQNGSFNAFSTPNYPDNFLIGVGVAGTQILNGGANTGYLPGCGSLEFVGDATAAGVAQSFGTAPSAAAGVGGTSAVLKPDTVYHFTLPYKLSAGSPAAGTLEAALVDGSVWPGVVLADDAGTNNLTTVALTGVADTAWHVLKGDFRTPAVLPTTTPVARLRARLSVGLTPGTNVFLGQPTLSAPAGPSGGALYPGGFFLTMHRGPSRVIAGLAPDQWTLALSNSYSTSGAGLLQQWMERVFNLRDKGLQIPSSGSPTVVDGVIV